MTEDQFEWLTSDHGKRKAMFTKEGLRRKIKANPDKWKCDEGPGFERMSHVWSCLNTVALDNYGK